MRRTILLSAITLSLFVSSASANIVVDEVAVAFHKTTLAVGSVIDTAIEAVSEILGLHSQKVSLTHGRTISPAEMFQDAQLGTTLQPEEDPSLILASLYPELVRIDPPSSSQKLSANKGSMVLRELKKQEEQEDLTASEYTALATKVSQDASSAVPLLMGSGPTKSAVINWDGVTYDQNPNTEADALVAKMASTHTRNLNSALLAAAGR